MTDEDTITVDITEHEPTDNGVETRLEIIEDGTHHDEHYHRETTLQLLEDGGVAATQRIQGCYDSLTLSSEMVAAILEQRGSDDE